MTKTFKRILASSLAIACTVIAGVTAFATNAFGLFGETAQTEQVNHNQQTVFGNFFGNGMKITASAEESMSSTWYVNDGIEDYSAYDMAVNVNAPGFIYVSSTITESLQNHPINAIRVVENASGTFKLFKTTTLPTTGSVFNGELIEVASMTFTGDSSKITTHTFPEFTLNAGEYLVFGTPGTAWFKCQYSGSSLPVATGYESYSRVGNSEQAVSIVSGANLGIKVGYIEFV